MLNKFVLTVIKGMIKPTVIILYLTLGLGQCPGSSNEMSMAAIFASIVYLDKITKSSSVLPDLLTQYNSSKRAFERI